MFLPVIILLSATVELIAAPFAGTYHLEIKFKEWHYVIINVWEKKYITMQNAIQNGQLISFFL